MDAESKVREECSFCGDYHSESGSSYCPKCLDTKIDAMEKNAKTKPENAGWAPLQRLCRSCGKPLSTYNSRDECQSHSHAKDYRPMKVDPLPFGCRRSGGPSLVSPW